MLTSNALLQTHPRQYASINKYGITTPSSTALNQFFSDNNNKAPPPTNNVKLEQPKVNGNFDLFRTLELKDEALMQAQMAVSSLENALGSAVTNLENMQQQLQLQVVELERELEATKQELSSTKEELEQTNANLQNTQAELLQSQKESSELQLALAQSREAAARADQLEVYVESLKDDVEKLSPPTPASKKQPDNPFQIFSGNQVIPILNEWIAIKGTNEGEIQISGKVTNHPTIPDGDAIVTSPLNNPGQASEKKIVTTLSGSKYR